MAAITDFFTREDLGMARPRSVSHNIEPQRGGCGSHYGGGAQRISSVEQARQRWLAWQRMHMAPGGLGTRGGAADIGYNAGYDDWGNVYPGRGLGVRSGAGGTAAANSYFYHFVWLGGGNEQPTDKALGALHWLVDEARREGGAGLAVKPHSLWRPTGCPGQPLRAYIITLDGAKMLPSIGEPVKEPPSSQRNYVTVGDTGPDVEAWQRSLERWRPGVLGVYGADGIFGPVTRQATIRFYREVGLISSVADPTNPRVGPRSLEAMEEALKKGIGFRFRYTTLLSRQRNSRGPAVDEWQRFVLAYLGRNAIPGYHNQAGGAGSFGPQTHDATLRAQRQLSVKADGIVGPATRGAAARV